MLAASGLGVKLSSIACSLSAQTPIVQIFAATMIHPFVLHSTVDNNKENKLPHFFLCTYKFWNMLWSRKRLEQKFCLPNYILFEGWRFDKGNWKEER